MQQQRQDANTGRYKKMVWRAVAAIVFFFLVYFLLLLIALGLFVGLGGLGIYLIASHPNGSVLFFGAILIFAGGFLLVMLIRFLFTGNKIDLSHMIELSPEQEPRLFEYVHETARAAGAPIPGKIYLSPDVNASVFYGATFWSMFFPVKKNLSIGLGLLEMVSKAEFRSILAHEFGHFSQKSLRVSAYVYTVNKAIHGIMNTHSQYKQFAQQHDPSDFVGALMRLISGVGNALTWLLGKIYDMVNLAHLAMSREMEFHADEVAGRVGGAEPLITALLRMPLAEHAYNATLNYYNDKIAKCIKTRNVYPQVNFLMYFVAQNEQIALHNELPHVPEDFLRRFDKSKLVINNQWESHPSIEDRAKALRQLELVDRKEDTQLAKTLFDHLPDYQIQATTQLFSTVQYAKTPVDQETAEFQAEITQEYQQQALDPILNGYYDNKTIYDFDLEKPAVLPPHQTMESLFSNAQVEMVYLHNSLEIDIQILTQISQRKIRLKTFDYDGTKYRAKESEMLIPALQKEFDALKESLIQNDKAIYAYCYAKAQTQDLQAELKTQFQQMFELMKANGKKMETYIALMEATGFIQEVTPYEKIHENMLILKEKEEDYRDAVKSLLKGAAYQLVLTEECRTAFSKYLSRNWRYFWESTYDEDALGCLNTCMDCFTQVLTESFQHQKRNWTNCQARILRGA